MEERLDVVEDEGLVDEEDRRQSVADADHPQPRLHAGRGAGMTVSLGRLRLCGVLDWKFTVLSHNTLRGAAGAAPGAEVGPGQGLAKPGQR